MTMTDKVTIKLPKPQGYVIYNPATGLFAKKGYNGWSKTGNVWATLGHLKNHLSMKCLWTDYDFHPWDKEKPVIHKIRISPVYKGCVVIDVATGEETEFQIAPFVMEKAQKILARNTNGLGQTNYVIVEDN